MNKILKNTLILTAITLIAGTALGFVYEVTKEPIAQAKEKETQEACLQVFPSADAFEVADVTLTDGIDQVYTVKENGTDAGYVITTTDKDGFGGNIQITVGIKKDGTINGVSILSISETAGLGMKATEPSFYNQYVNKQADKFVVSKDGGDGEQIDALSGATITSRAVTGAVNAALGYYQNAFK